MRIAGIAVVQALDIGQQHQQRRADKFVTIAARRSLSPKVVCNSSTLTVSFSLMIGTAPNSNSVRIVLRMFR